MTPPYTVGDGSTMTAVTRFGKIGVLICADTFRTELLQGMRDAKPDLLLVPYGWAAPEQQWPEHGRDLEKHVRQVALFVHCPVVGADLVGEITHGAWAGQVYGGQSVGVDREGTRLALGNDRDRDLVMIEIK
jgi:predicted amidohydrolase